MKLRFEVDQAALFRRGIDCPKSIVHIEVSPQALSEPLRHLIANRLIGISVHKRGNLAGSNPARVLGEKPLLMADEPSLEGLIKAVLADAENYQEERELVAKAKAVVKQ